MVMLSANRAGIEHGDQWTGHPAQCKNIWLRWQDVNDDEFR